MGNPKIVLYLDIVSPFAYLAFHVVSTSPVFKDCTITYVPVFLGAIMAACGNTAPIKIKNKDKWIGQERLRWARIFGVPMADQMPPGFPVNTLPVERVLTAASVLRPEGQGTKQILARLYHESFANRRDVNAPEVMAPIFAEVFGEGDAKKVLEHAQSNEIKSLLRSKTDEALESGAFGLPWIAATNSQGETECFWGFDHLGQVTHHLGLERPQPGDAQEGGWKAML